MKKLFTDLYEKAERAEYAAAFLLAVVALSLALLWITGYAPVVEARGYFFIGMMVLLLIATVRPIARTARDDGYRVVKRVCGLSLALMVAVILLFYAAYFSFDIPATQRGAAEKILNFPPVFVAVWAAGMGWYVHYQAAAKSARTANAFAVIMQIQTSSEFRAMSERVQRMYPHGVDVSGDLEDARSDALLRSIQAFRALPNTATPDERLAARRRIERSKAIGAVRYLLNYYEFVAAAIKAGDLDEALLYETISPAIVSIFERSKPFRDRVCGPPPDGFGVSLAFEHLAYVVKGWETRLIEEQHKLDQARRSRDHG